MATEIKHDKKEEEPNINHIYYETHLRLKLPINYNYDALYKLCKEHNFHLSKNLFKKNDKYIWQMITYRSTHNSTYGNGNDPKKCNYDWFVWCIHIMKAELKRIGIYFDKVEIEECIYDSNEEVDKNWLK